MAVATNRIAVQQCDAESPLRQTGWPTYYHSLKQIYEQCHEQDHRRIKRRTRSMLGFKSETAARITHSGIELIHMMHKQQSIFSTANALSIKRQFGALAA